MLAVGATALTMLSAPSEAQANDFGTERVNVGGYSKHLPQASILKTTYTAQSQQVNDAWRVRLNALVDFGNSLPKFERLKLVNEFFNAVTYVGEGTNDEWKPLKSFVKEGGDCEDYAVAKYVMLKEMGFSPADMRIAVVRNTITGGAHAILVVDHGKDQYVLDNLQQHVVASESIAHYRPDCLSQSRSPMGARQAKRCASNTHTDSSERF